MDRRTCTYKTHHHRPPPPPVAAVLLLLQSSRCSCCPSLLRRGRTDDDDCARAVRRRTNSATSPVISGPGRMWSESGLEDQVRAVNRPAPFARRLPILVVGAVVVVDRRRRLIHPSLDPARAPSSPRRPAATTTAAIAAPRVCPSGGPFIHKNIPTTMLHPDRRRCVRVEGLSTPHARTHVHAHKHARTHTHARARALPPPPLHAHTSAWVS